MTERSPWWRRVDLDERGQTTVLVVIMLPVLILFVAIVANVGQAVNRRVALQVIADAGAYTGATKMAQGMNYIATANGIIQDVWATITVPWAANTAAVGGACAVFDGLNKAYKAEHAILYLPMETINRTYGGLRLGLVNHEAVRVSEYNRRDLFPGEKLDYAEYDMSKEVAIPPTSRDVGALISLKNVSNGTRPETKYPSVWPLGPGYTYSITQPCWTKCGWIPCPTVRTWKFPAWKQRSGTNPRHFVWVVTAPATRALMFDQFFGPRAVPQMKAVGVAKPIGGDIKKGYPTYVAEMVPTSRVGPGFIYDAIKTTHQRRVTH